MSEENQNQSRGARRRIAREGAYEDKLATIKDVRLILDRYHTLMADPRVQFLEEYVFYKKMRLHERAYYHWLNFKGWCRARARAFGKWRYAQRWYKKNDEVRGPDGEV